MVRVLAIIFAFVISAALFLPYVEAQGYGGIVVTIPIIQGDVEKIVNGTIPVESLVKPGVDPHEFQLSPSDVVFLRNASLIISTLHTYAEMQIDSMIKNNELKAAYIAIPKIPGIEYEVIPNNGIKNPHMPIYDPKNYLKFIANLTQTLDELYPNLSYIFDSQYRLLSQDVQRLIAEYGGKMNTTAVASVPRVQYAVEWTGLKIARFLVVDKEAGVQPQDVNLIEQLLSNGTAKIAVVAGSYDNRTSSWIPYSQFDKNLADMATKYGAKVIYVPTVEGTTGIDDSLHVIVEELFGGSTTTSQQMRPASQSTVNYMVAALVVAALLFVGVITYRRSKYESD